MEKKKCKYEKSIYSFISVASLLLFVTIFITYALYIRKENETIYLEAEVLENNGYYSDAYLKYINIIPFGDSAMRAEQIYPYVAYQRGEELYHDKEYIESIKFLIDSMESGITESDDLLYEVMISYLNENDIHIQGD